MINFNDVVTAHFKNRDYTIIEVLYRKPDSTKIQSGFINTEEQPNLLEKLNKAGYNAEKLVENASEYKRQSARVYNSLINKKARDLAKEMLGDISLKQQVKKSNYALNDGFFNEILQNGEDDLFKLKLWALNQEFIKESKDKQIKSGIRKSKSMIEVFALMHKIKEGEA